MTIGSVSANPSPFDFCYYIHLRDPIPEGMSPNGMSGAPVYGITAAGMPVYCGMVIEYTEIFREYLVVGPEVLVNALRKLDGQNATGG